ncbi:MAG TPA: hypothetical protein PKJ88_04495 [Flexilinea sp.]|jgi:hypothetical protein|nr:hypothetical protein [Flexilinea sp.]HOG20952.1 hypothetical protein [Flexilinea sp.]HPL56626.1 hypothetical protein [Flexilinea sp.]HQF80398.1 hypothetical protein [Flexilinea sp.]HQN62841.1 hypothetical protein [Flexilinea sp.]
MKEIISSFVILILGGILQGSLFSRIHILNGTGDVIMVMLIVWSLNPYTRYSWIWLLLGALIMTYLSALPLYGYFFIYGIIWLFIRFLKSRFWQMPIILMIFVTITGSIISAVISYFVLYINDISPNLKTIVTQIAVPSLVLNLIYCFPIYGLLNDFANSVCYKEESS